MKNIVLVLAWLLTGCALSVSGNDPLSIVPTAKEGVKWWMPRHEQKIVIKEKMENVDLVFLGDSITHAWDSKGQKVWLQYYVQRNALKWSSNIGHSFIVKPVSSF